MDLAYANRAAVQFAQKNMLGGILCNVLTLPKLIHMPRFAQRYKRFAPLVAAPAALLLSQGQAKAVLTYNIFESAGNVVVETNGSLDLTGAMLVENSSMSCIGGSDGALISSASLICTGLNSNASMYSISGPPSFNGTAQLFASSASGISTLLIGAPIFGDSSISIFGIDPAYLSTTPIVSSATFNGETLASLGFTTSGLIGTWSLTGTSETIQVFLGNPPAAAVPGPLPLLGIGAAFGWSRRLRKRIAAPVSTPPQA